jgi:hypothetical protein
MLTFVFALGALVGVLLGVAVTMMYFGNLVLRATRILRNGLSPTATAAKTSPEEQARAKRLIAWVKEAGELSQQQINLYGQLEQPSKSASHSRWKNDLASQIRGLETKKMEIFRAILADGFDPVISVMNEHGEVVKVKLSDSVRDYDAHAAAASPPEPPVKISKGLRLVKNEEGEK